MDELEKLLKKLTESAVITLVNGKPKLKINLKKEEPMHEKKLYDTLFDLGQKVDWTKLNEYLKKIQNEIKQSAEEKKQPTEEKKQVSYPNGNVQENFPLINIYEYDNKYEFWIYATGFSKEEIEIGIEKIEKNYVLVISGGISSMQENLHSTTPTWLINTSIPRVIKTEWTPSDFKRTFKLNDDVDITNIKAHHENGVLRIALWKTSLVNSKVKIIDID